MLDFTIKELANQLNQYLMRNLSLSENIVEVSNIVAPDGSVAANIDNKVILSLCSIERDTATLRAPDSAHRSVTLSPPLFLNLYVMVAANFTGKHYADGLRLLSLSIAFFHNKAVFDRSNTPELDPAIDKLVLDIKNLTPHEMSNVWGLLGGRYLPSVLYRIRVVAPATDLIGRTPLVVDPSVDVAYPQQAR